MAGNFNLNPPSVKGKTILLDLNGEVILETVYEDFMVFNPDGSMFFSTPALKVEFLGPKRGRGDKSSQYIKDLSVSPQLLRFMDMLLKEPFTLRVSRNINVKLPSPGSFFLHKLLYLPIFQFYEFH